MSHVLGHGEKTLSEAGTLAVHGVIGALDPRVRIVLACVFGIVTVSLTSIPALLLALSVSVAFLGLSRLPMRQTFKRMAMMDSFIIFMLVMLPFTMPGEVMFTLAGWPASWDGLWRAVEIALTANAVILALMVLVGSMEPVTMGHALYRLRCPETLVHLLMFTIRYIEVLREEYMRLRAAMKVRGFRPGTNWHTYRSFGYLVGMMLVRAIERSERILGAMKCRGFSGKMVMLQDYQLTRRDYLFTAGFLAICVMLVVLNLL
jgi:cobalt/nickel transport system permease protein